MTRTKDFTALIINGKWLLHNAVVNQTSQGNVKCWWILHGVLHLGVNVKKKIRALEGELKTGLG